jgi:hypothetical protein
MKTEERRKNVEQQSNDGTKLFDAFVSLLFKKTSVRQQEIVFLAAGLP